MKKLIGEALVAVLVVLVFADRMQLLSSLSVWMRLLFSYASDFDVHVYCTFAAP
jgi:hypothetical protein